MTNNYHHFIQQSFNFPQNDLSVSQDSLHFHGIPLIPLIEKYGTPLRLTYLPKISQQIQQAKNLFKQAFNKYAYKAKYYYCYCTKSAHFSFILNEALKNDIHLEISSDFDIDIVQQLYRQQKIDKNIFIICNGFKPRQYISRISTLINNGFVNTLPVIDNIEEFGFYQKYVRDNVSCNLGIRIAVEEEPTFEFYTSRLGVRYKDIVPFYQQKIRQDKRFNLRMLHFFISGGIKDDTYYWNELDKIVRLYCALHRQCPTLQQLNIGGGLPIHHALDDTLDYAHLINEIIRSIKTICAQNNVPVPDIFTEFGSFTVGESGAIIFKVLAEKQQNDREKWYMLNGSLITTLPDIWAIKQRFIVLPINAWNMPYQRISLGGITCDENDFYSADLHKNNLYLPIMPNRSLSKTQTQDSLYVGFFNIGAYQEALSGYGGIKHCLMPSPQHLLLHHDTANNLVVNRFSQHQQASSMLNFLGY